MSSGTSQNTSAGSLLDGIDVSSAAPHARAAKAARPFVPPVLRDNRVVRWCDRNRLVVAGALALLLIGGGVWIYLSTRFEPPPDYATAPMDDLLDYTFITDDFNKLPIDKRLDLLRELIKRYGSMSSSDSVAMAAFAAMIEGDLREQMMKNASLVAIDLWDKFAADYQGVPETQRGEWMDQTVVDFMRMMDSFNPRGPREATDEKLLEEARTQASRDVNAVRSGQLSSGDLGQMADFMRNGMGRFAAPQTQTRAAQLMRDMTRHLRGQDIVTGKPKK